MRKILILSLVLFSALSFGQGAMMASVGASGGSTVDPYDVVYAAMTTKPTGDTVTWQNNLTDSIDAIVGWSNVHCMLVPATTDNGDGEALLRWEDPTVSASEIGTLTWTKNQGYASATSTANSISTNYNPNTDGLPQNAATFLFYTRGPNRVSTASSIYAVNSDQITFQPRSSSDNLYARMNSTSFLSVSSQTNSTGLWLHTRRASDDIEMYRNGASIDSESDASTGVPDYDLELIRGSNEEFSIFIMLKIGVTDSQSIRLMSACNTYMTNLGTNVY